MSVNEHSESYRITLTQGIHGTQDEIVYERFSTSLWGLVACGVYLVAYECGSEDKTVRGIWVSRRGANILSPGKLDVTAAGGIRAGNTSLQSIFKEAKEEASLNPELVETATPTGPITYVTRRPDSAYSILAGQMATSSSYGVPNLHQGATR